MQRADYQTLSGLGLTDEELDTMGLLKPATADPAGLMDAYLRRSNKKEDLTTLRGHLRDLVRYSKAEGLQIRHVWFEQLSASKAYVRRQEFEGCTQAVLDGLSKTMGVWKTDRFDRRGMGAVGRMLDEFDTRRARLVSVSEGLDSSKGGRMVFAILSERAREEAKDIALRVKIGHDSHKAENRRGTGVPPFGLFSKRGSGTVEPHEGEKVVARRIADLLLEGNSAMSVANTLNAEGVTTRKGTTWSGGAISRVVQSPLFAGMVPQRERVTDEHGNPLGRWRGYGDPALDEKGNPRMCGTGIVTPGEWYLIKGKIDARTGAELGKGTRRGKPGAKYQGTAIYRCGRMRDKGNGTLEPCLAPSSHRGGYYQCTERYNRGVSVCQGFHAIAPRVDKSVGLAWIDHVKALDPGDPVLVEIGRRWLAFSDPETQAKKEHAREALQAAQKRVQKLEDDYYLHGKLSEQRYEQLSKAQQATIQVMSATLEGLDKATDFSLFMDGESLTEAWEDASLTDRRMLLQCALGPNGVIVAPARGRGDRTPIEERLSFDWLSK